VQSLSTVSLATNGQVASLREIDEALGRIRGITTMNAESAGQSSESCDDLAGLVGDLTAIISGRRTVGAAQG
jgi:methyl-accepting chemotaxis protein